MDDIIFDIIQQCWHQDPEKRPNFREIYVQLDKLCSKHGQIAEKLHSLIEERKDEENVFYN
jgi:hypothetical protein